jgi:hypothetical protein
MTKTLYIFDHGSHWTTNWWLNYGQDSQGVTRGFNIHSSFKDAIEYCRDHYTAYDFVQGEFDSYVMLAATNKHEIDIFDDASVALFYLSY